MNANDTHDLPVAIEPDNETPTARYDTRDNLWREPGPSAGDRKISKTSRGAARAVMVSGLAHREIHCESGLEAKVAVILLTHPAVRDIREQVGPVVFIDSQGKQRQHYFDFVVTLHDDRKIAIAVRPAERVKRLEAEFENLTRYAGRTADGYVIVTDKMIAPWQVINAMLILSARREPNAQHDAAISNIVATLHGQMQIADLVEASDLAGDGFRAVVRHIDAGALEVTTHGVINYETFVQRVGVTIEGEVA